MTRIQSIVEWLELPLGFCVALIGAGVVVTILFVVPDGPAVVIACLGLVAGIVLVPLAHDGIMWLLRRFAAHCSPPTAH